MKLLVAMCLVALATASVEVTLVSFDGKDPKGKHAFSELNDPVMGGKSNGTWTEASGYGILDGNVNTIPSLKAPGFIEAWANTGSGTYNDASAAFGGSLVLTVRSSTPTYEGFRVTFASGALVATFSCAAGGSIIGSRGCFKAKFSVPPTTDGAWTTVRIPFTSFSDKWSSSTGEQTVTCAKDKSVCPTAKGLGKIQAVGLWGEGKLGHVHLEVQSIVAEGPVAADEGMLALAAVQAAPTAGARPPAAFDTCMSTGVQGGLRYNISTLTSADLTAPVAVDANESLATAICCDNRTAPFAEPRFLFQSPYVDLYKHMSTTGPTTFYDSVCGLPLFHAPLNRSLAEFQADTNEHGWPSFRPAELIQGNVRTDKATGFVFSKCGTHLGSFLPDAQGDRWCLDLSCLAGNPAPAAAAAAL